MRIVNGGQFTEVPGRGLLGSWSKNGPCDVSYGLYNRASPNGILPTVERAVARTLKKRVRWVGEERRSMSEENVNIMRQGYEAFNRGDIDTVMGLLDESIEWQEPDVEGLPIRGTHHGPEAVANNVFQPLGETWDDFQVVAEEFLDAGERVVVLGRFQGTAKATGRTVDAPFAHVWTMRDGKLVHHRNYTETATLLQALG